MKKAKCTKYRFILSLTDLDVAYERLFIELVSIDSKYSEDEASKNQAKRKLFLKILLAYCNSNTPSKANAYTTAISSFAVADPTQMRAPSPPPTPPPDPYQTSEVVTPPTGLRQSDGRIHFGDLKIDID